MNKDEVWGRLKRDSSTVYGKAVLDAFLEVVSALDAKHYEELPQTKRSLLQPQIRLAMARTPEEASRAVKDGAEDITSAAYQMGMNGAREALEWVVARRTTNKYAAMRSAFNGASGGGHREIMEWIMGMGRDFWDSGDALWSAGRQGQIETAKWLASKGANEFFEALKGAAAGGHIEVANWALDNNVSGFGSLEVAAGAGQLEMVKWLVGKGVAERQEKDAAMYEAARSGRTEVTRWLADNESKRYKWAFEGAVLNGHEETARLLLGYLNDLDAALLFCAERGSLAFVKMTAEAGAKDFENAYRRSIGYKKDSTTKWLIDSGKFDLKSALAYASAMQKHELADYIREKINNL